VAQFDLGDMALKLLDAVVAKLEEQSIVMPPIVYLAPGNEIVWDCEQFTLHLTRVIGQTGGRDSPAPMAHPLLMNSAEFFATMVRCIPVPDDSGKMPDPAATTAASQMLMRDARAIRRAFEMIDQQHLIVPRNVPCTIGQVASIGPSGGYAAVAGSFTFQMVDVDWFPDSPAGMAELRGKDDPVVMGGVKEYAGGN
jgi:hypothetical protein